MEIFYFLPGTLIMAISDWGMRMYMRSKERQNLSDAEITFLRPRTHSQLFK